MLVCAQVLKASDYRQNSKDIISVAVTEYDSLH